MFVKQHFMLDVIVGLAVSTLSYKFLVSNLPFNADPCHQRRNRIYAASLCAVYTMTIVALFIAYKFGWAPWSQA
jgi:hypothetical protein